MRVIGVLDLLDGRAVHARAGDRARYAPVPIAAGVPIAGDALALARTYRDRLGVDTLYAADLDAIQGGVMQRALITELVSLGLPLWLDAGSGTPAAARAVRALGAARVVVGLETLREVDALASICAAVGGAHVAFSLDLRGGTPLVSPALAARHSAETLLPEALAAAAARAGVNAILVLDLARVGTSVGLASALLQRVCDAAPGIGVYVAGGVRGPGDLQAAADVGCAGALVASALHDGRLTRADLEQVRARASGRR